MDYVTRQFINLTKNLRKDLRSALSLLRNSIEHQNKAIREAINASKEREYTPTPRTELYVPPSDRYKRESKDTRQLIVEHWKLYLEIVGIMVIVAYTVVSFFQWQTAHDAYQKLSEQTGALKTANDIAVASNRPWVGFTSRQFQSDAESTLQSFRDELGEYEELHYLWFIRNAGKRPARIEKIRTTAHWFEKNCTERPDYSFIPAGGYAPPGARSGSHATLLPDTTLKSAFQFPIPMDQWRKIDSFPPQLRFCIYSRIEYRDVDYPSVLHYAQDCRFYQKSNMGVSFPECDNNYPSSD